MKDFGIKKYDKGPYYRTKWGAYSPVYRTRDRIGRIERGIGPFIKLLAGITIFLVIVGMTAE